MTLREFSVLLWKGSWIVLSVITVAVATAAVFLQREEPYYGSVVTVGISPAVADAAAIGSLGGTSVSLGSELILTPTILDEAAALAGTTSATLAGAIELEIEDEDNPNRIDIWAFAATPRESQLWANAVAEAYNRYLTQQIEAVGDAARARQAVASQEADALQAQFALLQEADDPPRDWVLETRITRAAASLIEHTEVLDDITAIGPPLTIIHPALPGESMSEPLAVWGAAIMGGLIAGIGILLVRDQFDERLRGEREVARLTGVQPIGTLPYDRRAARSDLLPVARKNRTAFGDAVRTLRSSLQVLATTSSGPAAIVVTGVEPGDGSTFASANLAAAWARAGKRVVLVDGDLRRSSLADRLGDAAEGSGLSDLLRDAVRSGEAPTSHDVDRMLKDSRYPGLRVLPAGSTVDDPADLLGSQALGAVVDRLTEIADIVVIDSPPAMGFADAGMLETHADGVVILASERYTLRDHLSTTVGALEAGGANILGVVVNRAKGRLPRSYRAYFTTQYADDVAAPVRSAAMRNADDAALVGAGASERHPSSPRRSAGRRARADE